MSFIRSALLGTMALGSLSAVAVAATPSEVLENYGDIAQAAFEDSLTTAKILQDAIDTLVAAPTEDNLKAARHAWIAARNPYQQTEVFRFGNAVVDDWEGKVNAWPLDEGLIDYVDGAYGNESEENPFYAANIIANTKVTVAGEEIDATEITPELLSEKLQEAGEVDANVATGYHAIEFLLWGQDLNGTGIVLATVLLLTLTQQTVLAATVIAVWSIFRLQQATYHRSGRDGGRMADRRCSA